MPARKLSNISLEQYRFFLGKAGCRCTRRKGGHEHWTRADLNRPITLSSHIDTVAEFIIKNGLRILNLNKADFVKILFIE